MKFCALLAIVLAACGGASSDTAVVQPAPTGPVATASASAMVPNVVPTTTTAGVAIHAPTKLHDTTAADSAASIAKRYGGATVSLAQRARLMGDFGVRFSQLAASSRADRERDAVAWLKARPEIEDAGIAALDVWARFKDGKMLLVPTYDWVRKPGAKHADARTRGDHNAKGDIPESKSLALVDAIHYDGALNSQMRHWSTDHGYVATGVDGTVEALRTGVKNVGVFYINSHGAKGFERETGDVADRSSLYALMTTTPVLDSNSARMTGPSTSQAIAMDANAPKYEDELAKGELVYFYASVADPTGETWRAEWRYGITHRFARRNFTFSKDAFVFLNACGSFSDDSIDMTSTLWSLHPRVLLGWSFEVIPDAAMRASEFLFDRMLGANKMSSYGLTPDKPKQRPWGFVDTFADMQAKGYDRATFGGDAGALAGKTAQLDYWNDGDMMLVPSIKNMEVDELKKELTLHGEFGPEPQGDHKVTMGGASCPVTSWAEDKIVCTVPETGDGVVVVEKLGRKSNEAPLTSWIIRVLHKTEYQNAPGQFGTGIAFEAHVRADVHKYRETPSGAPKDHDAIPFYVTHDSKCAGGGAQGFVASGTGKGWMTNGSSIPVMFERPSGSSWCTIYGEIDPQNKKIRLAIFAITNNAAATVHGVAGGYGMGHSVGGGVVPVPGLFDGSVHPPPGMNAPAMPTGIDLALDDKGNISQGKKGPVDFANGHAKISLEWQPSTPTAYPTDETPQ